MDTASLIVSILSLVLAAASLWQGRHGKTSTPSPASVVAEHRTAPKPFRATVVLHGGLSGSVQATR